MKSMLFVQSKKILMVIGLFLTTAMVVFSTSNNGIIIKSSPYISVDSSADADLARLTNGAGASILDGVIAKVKSKAIEKAGTSMNIQAYNAYIDNYLTLVDELDNKTRLALGSDYTFIFKYIYPRVYGLKKTDNAATSIFSELDAGVNLIDTGSSVHMGASRSGVINSASGIFAMYQDEKMILKNNVAPLYVLDKSKGVVTFKWDVRSADGCRMAVGYSKKGLGFGPTTNDLDTDKYWMPSSGEKTVSLSATTNDFFSDGNTDPGYIYYAQLRCGAKSKRWAEYSMDTSMDLNFIEVKAVTVLGGSNATGIQTAATIDRIDVICAGNGWPASIDVYESENLNIVAKKNGIFLRHINPIRDTSATMSVYRAQLTGDETTIEAQSINSTQPALAPVSVSSCRTNPYPPKPEIVSVKFDVSSKQLVVKTKNALDSDYIDIDNQGSYGSLFWEKDGNGTYTAKLTDPYYAKLLSFMETGKSSLGIFGSFEPNYWRNSVRDIRFPIPKSSITTSVEPTFEISRTCNGSACSMVNPGDMYGANWTTTNATKVSFTCTGPVTSSNVNKIFDVGLSSGGSNFSTYEGLITGGWVPGNYICTWTIKGVADGVSIEKTDAFNVGT